VCGGRVTKRLRERSSSVARPVTASSLDSRPIQNCAVCPRLELPRLDVPIGILRPRSRRARAAGPGRPRAGPHSHGMHRQAHGAQQAAASALAAAAAMGCSAS
jgi:hypothetical protein